MGVFNKKENNIYEHIFANNILYDPKNKSIIIKSGFNKKEILIAEIIDFGIGYGTATHYSKVILTNKNKEGGLEKYFSGYYDTNKIPPISIILKLNNNTVVPYFLTISKTKKGRTLIIAEQIFDKLNDIINK